jgi:hypothetical protein
VVELRRRVREWVAAEGDGPSIVRATVEMVLDGAPMSKPATNPLHEPAPWFGHDEIDPDPGPVVSPDVSFDVLGNSATVSRQYCYGHQVRVRAVGLVAIGVLEVIAARTASHTDYLDDFFEHGAICRDYDFPTATDADRFTTWAVHVLRSLGVDAHSLAGVEYTAP